MKIFESISGIFFFIASLSGLLAQEVDFVRYVNVLQGTESTREFSNGNTYPAIARPWGMNFWTPQTGELGSGWQYTYQDTVIRGFKQTHQPSPWINDYGCFSIMPVSGHLQVTEEQRMSPFSHDREVASPHYYKVYLDKYEVTVELTPTERGAMFRYTFPDEKDRYLVIDAYPKGSSISIDTVNNRVVGYSTYYAKDSLPENFASYWIIQLPERPVEFGCWEGETVFAGKSELTSDHVGAYLKFDLSSGNQLEIQVASSFISVEQAEINLNNELSGRSFEHIQAGGKQAWNHVLGKIHVSGGSEEQLRTFYSAMYRLLLFPRRFYEFNEAGTMMHYNPTSGRTMAGPLMTDNGLWDTFRAVHPMYTILMPSFSNTFIKGMLNYYREGGWLPEWMSPGYRQSMIGQHSSSVILDAYTKGIRDYDVELAWEAVEKGANNEGPLPAVGRDGIHYYVKHGYIPYDVGVRASVSKTLEYAYNDYCLYSFAKQLNKPEETIEKYKHRAFNYRNVFDQSLNFVRPKDSLGAWQEGFYADDWSLSLTEGSSWHWIWSVFQDFNGLMNLMGGREALACKLDSMLAAEPTYRREGGRRIIHEILEMVAGNMGQYAHGNQPAQHALYLYNHAGHPYKAQKWIRHTMDSLYHSGPDGLCGDEDNGQTSAWYIFSALGFYPVTPGTAEYIIGAPLFKEATMHLEDGSTFKVLAPENSAENKYVQAVHLNGMPLNRYFLRHEEITRGGVLEFVMGAEPNHQWATDPDEHPFSLSELE